MTEPAPEPTDGCEPETEPEAAQVVFGDRVALARRYTEALATSALQRGLIGPREVSRLWSRHVLNCAVVADVVARDSRLVDVGSGAGLPGLVLAIARPDLVVTLVEPLQRRVIWLNEVVAELGLGGSVRIHRGRAEQMSSAEFDVATARAVAGLATLAAWCVPLVRPGGQVLAIKGRTAEEELAAEAPGFDRLGVSGSEILECGGSVLQTPTRVVRLWVGDRPPARRRRRDSGSRHGTRRAGSR